jgi:hypothetical protein
MSSGRCGAYATPSTQNRALGMVCTREERAAMSWMVPRMLEAWVHVTKAVLEDRRGLRESGVREGLLDLVGFHHFMVRDWIEARATQDAMLASWSIEDIMISEPAGKENACERLRKSWVVLEPRTGKC